MADDKPAFDKGDRAAIVNGKGAGTRGEVFWVGENKYGPGMRFGLRGDDGETYWIDETNIGSEDAAPPAPEIPKREAGPALSKGDTVRITAGQGAGPRSNRVLGRRVEIRTGHALRCERPGWR